MKFVGTLIALALLGFSTASQAVTVSPADCTAANDCITTLDNGSHDTAAFPILATLDLLYKFETDSNGEDGTALLASSYNTMDILTEGVDDFIGMTLRYNGGDAVDCTIPCYLVVKDGKHDPARYLFDLSMGLWNGTDELSLAGFWPDPDSGSISHFAIYGNPSPVPVPAAIWLFGTGLIGLVGFARRKQQPGIPENN